MASLKGIGKGIACFFISYFIALLLNYSVPYVLDMVGEQYQEITWFFTIIIWVLGVNLLPTYYIINGLREPDSTQHIQTMALAIIIFISAISLTYVGWYIMPVLASLSDTTILTVIYWTGLFTLWTDVDYVVVPV